MTDDTGLSRRRFLQATGGAAVAATLAGCASNPDSNGGGNNSDGGNKSDGGGGGNANITKGVKNPDPSKKLKDILTGTITTFDPVAATDTASGILIRQMFEGLMTYPNAKSTPKPQIAESYEVSSDYTTYTFKLKKGVKFHNGKTVTAEDFVYAFERLAASDNSRRAYFLLDSLGVKHKTKTTTNKKGKKTKTYKSNSMAVEAVDKRTLKVELSAPFHSSLAMFAYSSFAAVPKGIVGDIKGYKGKMKYTTFAAENPVGSGPFKFEQWKEGSSADVSRFEDYHGEKASIAGVHFQIIEKDNAMYNYSMNESADLINIPTSKYNPDKVTVNKDAKTGGKFGTYGRMRNGKTANYYRITPLGTYYIGFNMASVPKPVRQAFAHVTNQKRLVKEVFKGRGEAAPHLVPPKIFPGGADKYEKHAKKYPYGSESGNIEKAKQIMEKAGYSQSNKYTVQWTQYQSATWLEMAKILRQKLASVHIDMKIQQADFATLTERGRSGKLDVYTLGWVADWPAPDNFLQLLNPPQTDTSKPAPISYLNWTPKNGSAAKKATKAYQTVLDNQAPTKKAQKTRNDAYITMEEANWEDVGFLTLYHNWEERFWYDWVEIDPYGVMGPSRQQYTNVKVGKRK